MLHKRFKTAKCKTALKLATSRIKLMKNKKGVQINQMKRDLAQLLETGQDRTARIRVEHVIREEKMVAAYDLIEIYCELIVARLPIIESQKTCPNDLKEAVTSVIFAAPRCSDISELSDIRKQFTAKYGKEFVSAAIELHPDCGVSRMMVEKLSAVAPELQTKIKVLTAVAKDHNINWDPNSFEEKESKPPTDLLNGPSSFENASMENIDPPKIQPVHSHEEKRNAPFDFSEQNKKFTQSKPNVTPTYSGGETSSSGEVHEKMEMKQNWNLKFKDATSAAQAAAESAERAAMAARAAAQFSSQEKIDNHHPSGPHHASFNRNKPPHVSASSGSSGEKSSLDDRKNKISSNQYVDNQYITSQKATERFDGSTNDSFEDEKLVNNFNVNQSQHDASSQRVSERFDGYANDSIEDEKLVNISGVNQSQRDASKKATERFDRFNTESIEDGYYEESLHEDHLYPERESKTEFVSGQNGSIESENYNLFATKKQSSIRSSASSDELVGRKTVVGNPFAVVDQESPFKESIKTNSIVKDESISDHDDGNNDDDGVGPRFDTGFDYDEIESTHSLENAYNWRSKTNTVDQPNHQSHIFTESQSFGNHSMKSVETDTHEPASFDHSDDPDSESDNEILSLNPEPSSVTQTSNSRKTRIELNDLVEVEPSSDFEEKEMQSQHELKKHDSRKTRIEMNDLVEVEPSSDFEEKEMQFKHKLKKHDFDQESSFDTLVEEDNNDSLNPKLNFGTLTGGLKHKGILMYPPYTKSTTIEKSTEESSVTESQIHPQNSLDSKVNRIEDKKPILSDSDSDEKAKKQANRKSIFSPPVTYFDDDGSDSEDVVPKQAPNKARLGSGLSRRTRGSPSTPNSKTHVEPKPEPEPEPKPKPISQQPSSPFRKTVETGKTKSTASETRVNYSSRTKQEAKNPINEHNSSSIAVESGKLKNAKTPNLGSEKSEKLSGDNLAKKPSHVHPKLPDYDSLAARLQSMRSDRQ